MSSMNRKDFLGLSAVVADGMDRQSNRDAALGVVDAQAVGQVLAASPGGGAGPGPESDLVYSAT